MACKGSRSVGVTSLLCVKLANGGRRAEAATRLASEAR